MLRSRSLIALLCVFLLTSCVSPQKEGTLQPKEQTSPSSDGAGDPSKTQEFLLQGSPANAEGFGTEVAYEERSVTIHASLASDFATAEAANLSAITEEFGITLTDQERKLFAERKFIMKRLPETTILPRLTDERGREFLGLYNTISGDNNARARTQANTLFWSADIFLHSYTLLAVELLKEMENTVFAPAMRTMTKAFFEAAQGKLSAASDPDEVQKWQKVRNYFTVPHALFSTSIPPLTADSFTSEGAVVNDPSAVREAWEKEDKVADTEEKAAAFIRSLKLDSESEKIVLADLKTIFASSSQSIPAVFQPEYEAYAAEKRIKFLVDFSQFTPRSHYTSSSLRRQYFRAMNWYIQLPFFVGNDELTDYAFGISELFAEQPEHLKSYGLLESTINFLVGTSDDLMPVDYLRALEETKGKPDPEKAIREYLLAAKEPRIKNLPAQYPTVGEVASADVTAATKGMRFFSGKFILDSSWTDFLTQGDEAPLPGYSAKLPPMASSLEVMALLGSDYAREHIPTLDFYTPANGKAIDKAIQELAKETEALTEDDWRENAYTTALWTIRGLFGFEKAHRKELPRFMQNADWPAKTLMTAAGFWTEMRHAVLLYAKQSFAEKGGGGGCDDRKVPDPPKAYLEPQPIAYRRLRYLAARMNTGLENLGFTLENFYPLEAYVGLMDKVIAYTDKQLANAKLIETVVEHTDDDPDQPDGKCVWYEITESDWEALRRDLIADLDLALPHPVEGPVLPAKDKRAGLVADVHTGGDSSYDTHVLYEGIGVPHVILVAVKDANGPRAAIGFTYAQYEVTEPLTGKRMTDEDWQEKFYKGTDENEPFLYTDPSLWPSLNPWYAPLFGNR